MRLKFSVQVLRSFFTFELLNLQGEYIYDLKEAIEQAELQWGNDWISVFNGQDAAYREDQLNG